MSPPGFHATRKTHDMWPGWQTLKTDAVLSRQCPWLFCGPGIRHSFGRLVVTALLATPGLMPFSTLSSYLCCFPQGLLGRGDNRSLVLVFLTHPGRVVSVSSVYWKKIPGLPPRGPPGISPPPPSFWPDFSLTPVQTAPAFTRSVPWQWPWPLQPL